VREWLLSPAPASAADRPPGVLHFQRERVPVRTDNQAMLRNRDDPVKARRRNRRVEIVYLVCGDRRSPEQRESYVSEGTLLCCAAGPILPLHHSVVSCRTAKRDSISLIVGTHACKGAAPGDSTFEMVDMRRFEVWACGLIVAAILV